MAWQHTTVPLGQTADPVLADSGTDALPGPAAA
jgi:hypothetical protein